MKHLSDLRTPAARGWWRAAIVVCAVFACCTLPTPAAEAQTSSVSPASPSVQPGQAPQTPTTSGEAAQDAGQKPAASDGQQAQALTPPDQSVREQKPKPATEPQKPEEQPQLPPINYDVVVTAPRMDIPLKDAPAATAVVPEISLQTMPRGIAADEALRLVPGMKVDNQANGERVHLSIRGQGLLTERGVRGIKVLLDGLPLNDPTGFVPDLFDIDWSTVSRVEVLRGPSSALYGGGAAGGIISVTTNDGSVTRAAGDGEFSFGSNAFWKGLANVGGTAGALNYRMSLSHTAGDGYRVHTAFDATNFYSKIGYTPTGKVNLTAVVAGTSYFNQNAEGLNKDQVAQDPTQPNPDALKFNEYQDTQRLTVGLAGQWALASNQDVLFSAYARHSTWEESVPSTVQHRTYNTPGVIAQYSLHGKWGTFANHFTVGTDLDWQGIDDLKYPNLGNAVEGPDRVADQHFSQFSVGAYALDRVEIGPRFGVMADLRYDKMRNDLFDHLQTGGVDLSSGVKYEKTTGRVGGSFNLSSDASLYASWGQGFTPPTTEELANNPAAFGGLNTTLVPATSQGEDFGVRGSWRKQLSYDVAFFHLATENDFGRFRTPDRPLETFYGNVGSSQRYGLETSVGWYPIPEFGIHAAYTYSHFKYTEVNSLFGSFADVYIPNSPANMFSVDAEYVYARHLAIGLSADISSGWYVDQSNVPSVDGYELINPRVAYRWQHGQYRGEFMFTIRNLFGQEYIAFTEPDPDGNSYQPGPGREFFLGARIWIGK